MDESTAESRWMIEAFSKARDDCVVGFEVNASFLLSVLHKSCGTYHMNETLISENRSSSSSS